MEPLIDTTALASTLVVSAAMIVLGVRKQLLVYRRPRCLVCRRETRACRCREGRA